MNHLSQRNTEQVTKRTERRDLPWGGVRSMRTAEKLLMSAGVVKANTFPLRCSGSTKGCEG